MKEIWKNLNYPYENYKISNFGKILNTKNNYLSSLNDKNIGYIRISLNSSEDCKAKKFLLHRLVAEYFLSDYKKENDVHHIDGNVFNNKIDNLQSINKKLHAKISNRCVGLKKRTVAQYDLNGKLIKLWDKCKDITDTKIFSVSGLNKALNGTFKTYNGYIWKYYDEHLENEIWKEIIIDNNIINVSNKGRIKLKSNKIIYGFKNKSGYRLITFNKKSYVIHRLIAIAFKPIENYDNFQVNHIDCNKNNNNIENLEWVTASENVLKYYEINNKKRNIIRKKVKRIDILTNNEIIYDSINEASDKNKITKSNICMACKKQRKSAGGYYWCYV